MNSIQASYLFLRAWASNAPEEAATKLAQLIDTFTKTAYGLGLDTAKSVYRELHPGQCKMLSQGDECNCFLCQMDNKQKEIQETA